jgi:hypothetical protein
MSRCRSFFPSPLVGEGGASRSEATGEGFLPLGKLHENVLQHGRGLLRHVIVPVAGDSKTFHHQDCFPCFITCGRCVLATVNFDDEALFEANKVENEVLEGDLPTKFETRQSPITKQSPHRQFRIGGLVAHLPGEDADAFGDRPMVWCMRREPLTRRRTSFGATLRASFARLDPTRGEGRPVRGSSEVLTPASASAHRARPCCPCPAPASASRDRRGAARRLRLRFGRRCRANSAS